MGKQTPRAAPDQTSADGCQAFGRVDAWALRLPAPQAFQPLDARHDLNHFRQLLRTRVAWKLEGRGRRASELFRRRITGCAEECAAQLQPAKGLDLTRTIVAGF